MLPNTPRFKPLVREFFCMKCEARHVEGDDEFIDHADSCSEHGVYERVAGHIMALWDLCAQLHSIAARKEGEYAIHKACAD